jgi:hypothetical protein
VNKEHQEAALEKAFIAFQHSVHFVRPLTVAEVSDFVSCIKTVLGIAASQVESVSEHMAECDNDECNAAGRAQLEHLHHLGNALSGRLSDLAPALARQKELMEAKLVKSLGLTALEGGPISDELLRNHQH